MEKAKSEHAINRIRQALLSLLQEEGYPSITVSQLAKRASMNRTTFYLFFASKEEMLDYFARDIIDTYIKELVFFIDSPGPDQRILLEKSFALLKQQAPIVRVAWSLKEPPDAVYPHMVKSIEGALIDHFTKTKVTVNVKLDFFANLYAQSATATIFWWLDHCEECSEQEIASFVITSTYKGMAALLP